MLDVKLIESTEILALIEKAYGHKVTELSEASTMDETYHFEVNVPEYGVEELETADWAAGLREWISSGGATDLPELRELMADMHHKGQVPAGTYLVIIPRW